MRPYVRRLIQYVRMKTPLTPTELRANLYKVLDEVAQTGVPREVKRGDQILLILPATPLERNLDKLPKRDVFDCSIDELIYGIWEHDPESGL